MGELHVQMITTLDGVMQANGGPTEQDRDFAYGGWERPFWDATAGAQVEADVEEADALLLGRTTYDIFRGYWPAQTDTIGRAFNRVPKYVASRGDPEASWDPTTVISDAAAGVRDLRERHQRIHTWGSANLLRTLFGAGLVDQLNLWMCPVVIGTGKRVFPEGSVPARFREVESPRSFENGIILMRLRCVAGAPETVGAGE